MMVRSKWINWGAWLGLLLGLIFYLFGYFLPTVKTINRVKRETRDARLRVSDFRRVSERFKSSDQAERRFFQDIDKRLTDFLPGIRDRSEYQRRRDEGFSIIVSRARRSGVSDLLLAYESDAGAEMKVERRLASADRLRASMFTAQFATQRNECHRWLVDGASPPMDVNLDGMNGRSFCLVFAAKLKHGLGLLNSLPWGIAGLQLDRCLLMGKGRLPFFVVLVKMHFRDFAQPPRVPGGGNGTIDENAPLLLSPLNRFQAPMVSFRPLPSQFGGDIFCGE